MTRTHKIYISNLKSNMDRFIEREIIDLCKSSLYLKSNMDRFIAQQARWVNESFRHLKSNMDRFIGCTTGLEIRKIHTFKIQYG